MTGELVHARPVRRFRRREAARRAPVSRATAATQVGALVFVATGLWAALATTMAGPWVIPDEFIYSDLAKSIAAGHLPAVRGVTTFGYGIGYPLLIAPAWVVAASARVAYTLTLVTNAALMSLAAVPAYLLARRFVSHSSSLAIASLSVLLPAMAFTSMILTENAYYPAFLLALLMVVRSLEHPTKRRQVLAMGAIALAVAMKLLGVVLVGIFASVILLDALGSGGVKELRPRVREYRLTFLIMASAVVAAVAASAAAGRGAAGALGAYSAVFSKFNLVDLPWSFVLHVAALDLTCGFIPFAATVLVVSRVARGEMRDPQIVRFAAVTTSTMFWLALTIAVSAGAIKAGSAGAGAQAHLHERYLFAAAPLLLIGLAVVVERHVERRCRLALAAGITAALLAALIPVAHLSENAALQAPSLIPWLLFSHGQIALSLAAAVAVAVFVLAPVRRTSLPWGVVGILFATGALLASAASFGKGEAVTAAGVGTSPQWVDDAVGRTADVAVLWNEPGAVGRPALPRAAQDVVWVDEFFNRSVRRVLALGALSPEGLPETRVKIGKSGVLLAERGKPVRATFLLTCGVSVDAPVVARNPETSALLYRVDGPIHVTASGPSNCVGRGASSKTTPSLAPPLAGSSGLP